MGNMASHAVASGAIETGGEPNPGEVLPAAHPTGGPDPDKPLLCGESDSGDTNATTVTSASVSCAASSAGGGTYASDDTASSAAAPPAPPEARRAMHASEEDGLRVTLPQGTPDPADAATSPSSAKPAQRSTSCERVVIKPDRKPQLVLGRKSSFGRKVEAHQDAFHSAAEAEALASFHNAAGERSGAEGSPEASPESLGSLNVTQPQVCLESVLQGVEWVPESGGSPLPPRSATNPGQHPTDPLGNSGSFGQRRSSFLTKARTPVPASSSRSLGGARSRLPRTPGTAGAVSARLPGAARRSAFDTAESSGRAGTPSPPPSADLSAPLHLCTSSVLALATPHPPHSPPRAPEVGSGPLSPGSSLLAGSGAPTNSPLLRARTSSFGKKAVQQQQPERSPPHHHQQAPGPLLNVDIEWAKETGLSPPTSPQPGPLSEPLTSPGGSCLQESSGGIFGKRTSSFGKRPPLAGGVFSSSRASPPAPPAAVPCALEPEGTFLFAQETVLELRDEVVGVGVGGMPHEVSPLAGEGSGLVFSSPTLHPATPMEASGSGREGSGISMGSGHSSPAFGARRSSFGGNAAAARLPPRSPPAAAQPARLASPPSPAIRSPLTPPLCTRKSSFGAKGLERLPTMPVGGLAGHADPLSLTGCPPEAVEEDMGCQAGLAEMAQFNNSFMLGTDDRR